MKRSKQVVVLAQIESIISRKPYCVTREVWNEDIDFDSVASNVNILGNSMVNHKALCFAYSLNVRFILNGCEIIKEIHYESPLNLTEGSTIYITLSPEEMHNESN